MVSVLINCFNYVSFIAEAVESVLEQTVAADEILIVDDGSTDGSAELVEARFGGHYILGIESARGDIVCFLDADDRYERNHLENVAKAFSQNRDVDFVFTAHHLFGDAEGLVQQGPVDQHLGYSMIAVMMDRGFWVGSISSTLAVRRSLLVTLLPALRQVIPRWRVRADDCLVFGSSLAMGKKLYLAEPTVLYRVHGSNSWLNRSMTLDEVYSHNVRRERYAQIVENHLGLGLKLDLPIDWDSIPCDGLHAVSTCSMSG